MDERGMQKARRVFIAMVIGSAVIGIAPGLLGCYWFGIILAYAGTLSAIFYFSRITAGQEISDERIERINEKAVVLTFAVTPISLGTLVTVIPGLEIAGISLPASTAIGPLFAFIAIFYVIIHHYYERNYG